MYHSSPDPCAENRRGYPVYVIVEGIPELMDLILRVTYALNLMCPKPTSEFVVLKNRLFV